ncbi:MAG: ATP-binding protein, partial [Acidimicrobiia bacterium]|nr:ATP-binding protein [Acidimicrobiia bacterium]
MDLSGNLELQAIFREEVTERTDALVVGCDAMVSHVLTAAEVEEARRHAHTIKGNALVMGYPQMGAAAKLVEAALRQVEVSERPQSVALGKHLGAVARLFVAAIDLEPAGDPVDLNAAAAALEAFLAGPDPDPDPVPEESESEDFGLPTGPSAELPVPDLEEPEGPPNLGGLISTIENDVTHDVTRVETSKLYQLINRAVEVRLDTQAILAQLESLRMHLAGETRELWEAVLARLDGGVEQLQFDALDLAAVPIAEITGTFPQLVRYLSRRTGKEVRFSAVGDQVQVDRQIVDSLREPLRHLIVNAVDHGIEMPEERHATGKPTTATVELRFIVEDNLLRIVITDDGRGIDWADVLTAAHRKELVPVGVSPGRADLVRLLFSPGFSTIDHQGEISGDGFGLAAAAEVAELVNGGLHLESEAGKGTTITLTVPNSIVLQDVLVVNAEGQRWGIPEAAVSRTLSLEEADIRPGADGDELFIDGLTVAVSSFARAVGLPAEEPVADLVVLTTRLGLVGLGVSGIEGTRQVAVKGIGPILGGTPYLTGAALLGGGEVLVVVEPNGLAD